ncbi:hypothetical protein BJF92_04400 [Rhizobium rhizosphaerae]|uniref:Uncharacterized protein n=1 Tax=Xaviernesmea rhizosphaerae TaxID=1672749 RepID=A0A1Q9AFS5_9HYPH|nr:hypothetical protein [Xaviernesmea rhizosphaerae]OLP53836.1 hypothetical protein BJF92_04400 [Xaviernesmea rhizosphaerae]
MRGEDVLVTWGRGLFRVWIVVTTIWIVVVALFTWQSVAKPYILWGGFKMGQGEPEYLEPYGEKIAAARELKSRKLLVEYEIAYEKPSLRETAFFFPAASVHEDNLKAIEAYIPKATALQDAKVREARLEVLEGALWGAVLPPVILLVLGLAIRWALLGFRA